MLSPDLRSELEKIIGSYENPEGGLLPSFHRIQESLGYIPDYAMEEAASLAGVPKVLAYGVMSFYTLFYSKKQGDNIILACDSFTCNLMESEKVIHEIEKVLGIKAGETTPDGKFTLHSVACLGDCDKAPVMMLNWKMYENLRREEISSILEKI